MHRYATDLRLMSGLTLRDSSQQLTMRQVTGMQPETFDSEAGSVRFVAATESPTTVFDFEDLELVDEVLLMDGMQLPSNGRVPVLDAHSRFQVGDILGSASDFREATAEGYRATEALVTFAGVQKGREAAQLVREGHLTDSSVGYMVLERERIPKGESRRIRGRKYTGPMRVATKWELKEVSLTPIGADDLAKARNSFEDHTDKRRQTAMNKELRKFLERMGLDPNASEDEAKRFLNEIRARQDLEQQTRSELERLEHESGDSPDLAPIQRDTSGGGQGAHGRRSEPSGGSGEGTRGDGGDDRQYVPLTEVRGMIDDAVNKATQQALQQEYKRQDEIREAVRLAGYGPEVADEHIRSGEGVDQVRKNLFERMTKEAPPMGAGRISVGEHDQDKFRAAVTSGLLARSGVREEKPAPGYETWRSASVEQVARECLERMGVRARTLSKDQVAREILKRAGGASTDDFPSIFLDVANKNLLKAYREAPATWRPWVNVVSATDFKTIHGVSLSEAPDLELIDENGEYKYGALADRQESYSVGTYGKLLHLTRQMIVNDDMRAFTRLPRMFGAAARRKEADIVYSLLTSNPTMSDGNSLFSSSHNNVASDTGNVTQARLSEGRKIMRQQTGPNGAILDLQPAFLLTPVAQQTDAEVLLRSTMLPESGSYAMTDYNPWANALRPIAEPRLDNDSEDTWYLVADPSQADTIEVAFLDGNEAPYVEEQEEFHRDGISYKVRHDFGAGAMEWRSFFRNPGA